MPCQVSDRGRVMPAKPGSANAMKIGGVDFPEPLLNALRDGKLVVFAGAGVSMGAPARLPSFRKLAEKVAEGTGKPVTAPEDRFLGQLEDDGVRVHQRAANSLQPEKLEPNALHRNLLCLFQETGPVRILTTNEAPALPLGTLQGFADEASISRSKHRGNAVEFFLWRHLLSNDHHLTMGQTRALREATR